MKQVFIVRKYTITLSSVGDTYLWWDRNITYKSGAKDESVELGKYSFGAMYLATIFDSEEDAKVIVEALINLFPESKGNVLFQIESYYTA